MPAKDTPAKDTPATETPAQDTPETDHLPPTDAHFDRLAEHFADKIYNSAKGKIRLALLQQDLRPLYLSSPMRILDAGGGQGHISRWLAAAGHQVTLCDSSGEMLDKAAQLNREAGLEAQIQLRHCSIDQFCARSHPAFDLVLCHAVLEWARQPRELVRQLTGQLATHGRLSLMFYNQHSLVLRNALRGNLRKVKRADWSGDGKGLTPYQPLDPQQIYQWLQADGLTIDDLSGIRCFYDYLPPKVRQTYAFDDILELERDHYKRQPYIHMARYIHVLASRRPVDAP